jgi:hypothetical protein
VAGTTLLKVRRLFASFLNYEEIFFCDYGLQEKTRIRKFGRICNDLCEAGILKKYRLKLLLLPV